MREAVMCWAQHGERTCVMQLSEGGADWVEVKQFDPGADPTWRVEARLNGSHYKVRDAFPTKEAAQGCALLLAMRLLPTCRDALHAQLDAVPRAWWWKLTPLEDASAQDGSIFSSRVTDSPQAAEQSGRAAGRGYSLYVYGPGTVCAFGLLPK
jgi:hypothetical protein